MKLPPTAFLDDLVTELRHAGDSQPMAKDLAFFSVEDPKFSYKGNKLTGKSSIKPPNWMKRYKEEIRHRGKRSRERTFRTAPNRQPRSSRTAPRPTIPSKSGRIPARKQET
jgi:hypothetical protein